jgi:lipopolysaccharide/colanic/teichoic acid biosynthesis glycosyltransferase
MLPHKVDFQNLPEVNADNPYLTTLGRTLRKYGLDELPQLFNILKGDMSLVGPRPTIQEQVEKYTLFQRRRLDAHPGITGLAQVSGNTSLSWEDRMVLDVWYIDHWTFWLDLLILFRTGEIILKGRVMEQPIEEAHYLPNLSEARSYFNESITPSSDALRV